MIRIGIVDDHAIVRSGLRQFLGEHVDLRVTGEANNGREVPALAPLSACHYKWARDAASYPTTPVRGCQCTVAAGKQQSLLAADAMLTRHAGQRGEDLYNSRVTPDRARVKSPRYCEHHNALCPCRGLCRT